MHADRDLAFADTDATDKMTSNIAPDAYSTFNPSELRFNIVYCPQYRLGGNDEKYTLQQQALTADTTCDFPWRTLQLLWMDLDVWQWYAGLFFPSSQSDPGF
jgi:hypothetical protein